MYRLHRQANAQIPAVALEHADTPADDVVEHFVAAAKTEVVDGGCVILHVDPVRDDHGRGHDEFQHTAIGIALVIVIMQEGATLQVHSA